ncbi:hypothetical protein B9Z55_026458 [Caenorhabditis nigoni]|uniref:SET domain-containing protein n=1 Tax=Caenorhabditis nigoni TaxID=1611254 RepID=A0A2G5T3C9_9PELO|nr:hypothetical protein B9Z55_026458 [Caenorhabditis nigoni]
MATDTSDSVCADQNLPSVPIVTNHRKRAMSATDHFVSYTPSVPDDIPSLKRIITDFDDVEDLFNDNNKIDRDRLKAFVVVRSKGSPFKYSSNERVVVVDSYKSRLPYSSHEGRRAEKKGSLELKKSYLGAGIPTRKFSAADVTAYGSDPTTEWVIQDVWMEENGTDASVLYLGWTPETIDKVALNINFIPKEGLRIATIRDKFLEKLLSNKREHFLPESIENEMHPNQEVLKDPTHIYWLYKDLSFYHTEHHTDYGLGAVFYFCFQQNMKAPPKFSYTNVSVLRENAYHRCLGRTANLSISKFNPPANQSGSTACSNKRQCKCAFRARTIYNASENGSSGVLHLQHDTAGLLDVSKYQYSRPSIAVECSDACGCGDDCPNRRLQQGNTPSFAVVDGPLGFELFAMEPILKGQLLFEYVGEMLMLKPEKIRLAPKKPAGMGKDWSATTIGFRLEDGMKEDMPDIHQEFDDQAEFKDTERKQTYDATFRVMDTQIIICGQYQGNLARFAGHSCTPNSAMIETHSRKFEDDPLIPRIAVYAIKDIEVGQRVRIRYYLPEKMLSTGSKDEIRCKSDKSAPRREVPDTREEPWKIDKLDIFIIFYASSATDSKQRAEQSLKMSEEEEYEVETVLNRMEFDALLQKALKSEAVFNPNSVKDGMTKHSKYAYLVHWKNFPIEQRTWEPEENLRTDDSVPEVLAKFNKSHNYPNTYEEIDKDYGPNMWDSLMVAWRKVADYEYLYSPDEKREKKEAEERKKREEQKKIEAKKKKNAARAESEAPQKKEKRRVIIESDPEEEEEAPRKKPEKSNKRASSLAQSSESAKKQRSESVPPAMPLNKPRRIAPSNPKVPEFKKPYDKPPVVQKKKDPDQLAKDMKLAKDIQEAASLAQSSESAKKQRSDSVPPAMPLNKPRRIAPSNPKVPEFKKPYDNPPVVQKQKDPVQLAKDMKLAKDIQEAASLAQSSESAKKQRSESVPPAMPINKRRRIAPSQPKVPEFKKPYDKPPVVQKQRDPQLAKDIEEAKEKMKKLQLELKEFPVKVEGVRPTRPFTAALWNMKFRRCRSAESLNVSFFNKAEIEMFGRNLDRVNLVNRDHPASVKRVYENEKNRLKPKPRETQVIAVPEEDPEEVQAYKQLVEENQKKMELISHPFKKQLEPLLPELVKSYSNDDIQRFKTIFTENIPNDPKYDPHRYALVVFIISYFDHREWKADPNGMLIVEAKESVSWGKIRKQNPLCCKNHRKCAWLKLFMELVPSRLRFIETSKKMYNGQEGEDGPFRYDVYFHCMKYGAECQKRLFFIFGKPVNRQQKLTAKFNVDGMHLLAVQYGNIQRIAQYMSMAGADINAMATFLPTRQVFRLEDYLRYWIEKNAKPGVVHPIHADYYQNLLQMIRRTSASLALFVKSRVEEVMANRLNMEWRIHMELTYPHMLRCCPQSNISNGGDDCHQVLSCLFAPLGMALCDAIPDEGDVYGVNMHKVDKLRDDLAEFRYMVGKKEGRLVVALYRIEVDYKANVTDQYVIPTFKHIQNNEGYTIEGLNLVRQQEVPEKEDISLINFLPLTTPGSLYFCIENEDVEKKLVANGNVYIEVVGQFEKPATFVAQIFFISKNVD